MQKSLLFIPGPVAVSEPVLAAMAKPLINHRGPEYAQLLHSIADRMQSIFATKGDVLLMGASGTGSLKLDNFDLSGRGHMAFPSSSLARRRIFGRALRPSLRGVSSSRSKIMSEKVASGTVSANSSYVHFLFGLIFKYVVRIAEYAEENRHGDRSTGTVVPYG